MNHKSRSISLLLLLLLSACAPGRLSIYSRPGGAEVYVNEVLLARTVNEATPVNVDAKPGKVKVTLKREGYFDWSREVEAFTGKEVAVLADMQKLPPEPRHIPAGSLEIRTTPGRVLIHLNDEELGRSKPEALKPVKIEKLPPGTYKVRVEREGFEPAADIFRVFANQTTRATFELRPLTPWFAFPTNDDLMRHAVMRAVKGAAYMSGMSTKKSLVLVPLTGAADGDEPLQNLVEDALIAELASNGRKVAERNDHLLVRIANERARGDSMLLDILTRHEGSERPFLYDARLRSAADALTILKGGAKYGEVEIMIRPPDPKPAHLPTGDQILGYRLVEKTLRVDPAHSTGGKEPMLRREAIIRLYCRLLDAKTGLVEWAQRYEASVADEVPERVYRYLENPPSRSYAYEEGAGAEEAAGTKEDLELQARTLQMGNQAGALFWYYRNVGEAYLRAGRWTEAIENLKEAANLRPEDYETRLFLGEAYLKTGKLEEAGRQYRSALGTPAPES